MRNASYLTVFNRHSGLTRYIWSAAVGRELFSSTRTGGESVPPSKQLSKLLMAVTLAAFPHFTSRITWHAAMFQEFRILRNNVTMHQSTNLTNNVTLMQLVHKHKKTREDSHVCCCLPLQVQRLTNRDVKMKLHEKIVSYYESCQSPVDKEGYLYKKVRHCGYNVLGNLLFLQPTGQC